MKNWYNFNGIFYNTIFNFLVPQRKIGSIFKHKGKKYIVVESPIKEIGCTYKDPRTGNNKEFCAFCNNCNCISILKRGHCAHFDRKDNTSVAFKLYEERNKDGFHVQLIDFTETVPNNFIEEALRYIFANLDKGGKISDVHFSKQNIALINIYFVAKTLCLDIIYSNEKEESNKNTITICSDGSVGLFSPYEWVKNCYVEREKMSTTEFDIYKNIYEKVKGKKL